MGIAGHNTIGKADIAFLASIDFDHLDSASYSVAIFYDFISNKLCFLRTNLRRAAILTDHLGDGIAEGGKKHNSDKDHNNDAAGFSMVMVFQWIMHILNFVSYEIWGMF